LEDQLLGIKAEETQYIKQADIARQKANKGEASYAEVQLAQAQLAQVDAQIRLLERRISEATLRAPIDGTVIKGDLEKRIGGPVEKGEVLFEVAPLKTLWAELRVDESDIADVGPGDTGELATTGSPGEHIRFTVVRIDPVAEVVGQENVFRVRAELDEIRSGWKPGMEGVAKVELEPRPYAWLLTHKLIDWVRMKLWW
jgi:multidrug resistance efflux pump